MNPLGLHLRPAALLVRGLAGMDVQIQLGRPGGQRTDARSLLGVAGTGLRGGELVEVSAIGPAAEQALDAIRELVEDGFGELEPGRETRDAPAEGEGQRTESTPRPGSFIGLGVSPGIAAGPTLRLRLSDVEASSLVDRDCDFVAEQRRLADAVEQVRRELLAAGGDLSEAHALLLDDAGVAGLVTAHGSRTAHASLLARGLGLPMVVAVGASMLDLRDRTVAVVDGDSGTVIAPASQDQLDEARQRAEVQRAARGAAAEAARQPVVLADGRQVAVGANVGTPGEARAALQAGADMIGLLRTELLFLGKRDLPGEEE